MAIVQWSPFSRMLNQWPEAWEDDLWSFSGMQRTSGLEMYETEKEVVIKANVAGVPEDKIDLTFEKGVLTLSASMEQEDKQEEEEGRTYYARSQRQYSYSVRVPRSVDLQTDPEVDLEDGMVRIVFQKSQAAQPRKLAVRRSKKA